MNDLILVTAADMAEDGFRRRLKLEEVVYPPERIHNTPSPRAP
jgi:hypothetical protein